MGLNRKVGMVPALVSAVDRASKSACTMMTVPVLKSAALMDADGYATIQFQLLGDNLQYFFAVTMEYVIS